MECLQHLTKKQCFSFENLLFDFIFFEMRQNSCKQINNENQVKLEPPKTDQTTRTASCCRLVLLVGHAKKQMCAHNTQGCCFLLGTTAAPVDPNQFLVANSQ